MFDTTLRDGEQTPGVALTPEDKVRIATQLDNLGVDIIEAGFPIASAGEREGVKKIAGSGLRAEICGLARTRREDIDAALVCNVDRVHVFIATSDIHMTKKLKVTRDQVLTQPRNRSGTPNPMVSKLSSLLRTPREATCPFFFRSLRSLWVKEQTH